MGDFVIPSLERLFSTHFGERVHSCTAMKAHASTRVLYRLSGARRSAVGVYCDNVAENRAFISFAKHFRSCRLSVPEIFAVSSDQTIYLQEDLGDQTLFDLLQLEREDSNTPSRRVQDLYGETVRQLSYFQIEASVGLDYSLCVEGLHYDAAAMLYDCDRFRSELVDRMALPYNAERLSRDFYQLSAFLAGAESNYFLYRDFQARNIMVRNEKPYFIDFQSGRHGALQYDLASLLYQAQARLPESMRASLIDTYLAQVSIRKPINRDRFIEFFDGFVLIRLIQVLGAYGKLGLGENKAYFQKGIPFAVTTFLEVLGRQRIPVSFGELTSLFARLSEQLE